MGPPPPLRPHVLRQVTSGNRDNTTLILEIGRLRSELPVELERRPFELVRPLLSADGWRRAASAIEKDLWRNPVDKLQNLPGDPRPFLYTTADDPKRLQFLPGVVEALVRFGPVLRSLVEQRFADFVARANRSVVGTPPALSVHDHLFGADRSMPGAQLRQDLIEVQGGRCLWSGSALRGRHVPVDHVIPWSRQRLSVLENFAMTTSTANSSKSNLLLGPSMLDRWAEHQRSAGSGLAALAERHGWASDLGRTVRTAGAQYRSVPATTGVWDGVGIGVRPLGEAGRVHVLAALGALLTP